MSQNITLFSLKNSIPDPACLSLPGLADFEQCPWEQQQPVVGAGRGGAWTWGVSPFSLTWSWGTVHHSLWGQERTQLWMVNMGYKQECVVPFKNIFLPLTCFVFFFHWEVIHLIVFKTRWMSAFSTESIQIIILETRVIKGARDVTPLHSICPSSRLTCRPTPFLWGSCKAAVCGSCAGPTGPLSAPRAFAGISFQSPGLPATDCTPKVTSGSQSGEVKCHWYCERMWSSLNKTNVMNGSYAGEPRKNTSGNSPFPQCRESAVSCSTPAFPSSPVHVETDM